MTYFNPYPGCDEDRVVGGEERIYLLVIGPSRPYTVARLLSSASTIARAAPTTRSAVSASASTSLP